MKFAGLDVCKNRVVAWTGEELPYDIKLAFKQLKKGRSRNPEKDELTFYYNHGGIVGLLNLEANVWVLEPTGVHYSRLLVQVANHHGIEVIWVGHMQVANYRKSHSLPNKNDIADAYALWCYGLEHYGKKNYFVHHSLDKLLQMRELYYQTKFCDRQINQLINKVKQKFSLEFPEAMETSVKKVKDGRSTLMCWLANRSRTYRNGATYWQNRYNQSVAHKYNIAISDYTRFLAGQCDDYYQKQFTIDKQLRNLVYDEQFSDYNQVFDEFMFDTNLRAIILCLTYPVHRFPSYKHFKSILGLGQVDQSSGESDGKRKGGGSSWAKQQLYNWFHTKVYHRFGEVNKFPFYSEAGQKVQNKFDLVQKTFYENPNQVEAEIMGKALNQGLNNIDIAIKRTFNGTLKKESNQEIEKLKVELKEEFKKAFIEKQVNNQFQMNRREADKKLGMYIVGKVVPFVAEELYHQLKHRT